MPKINLGRVKGDPLRYEDLTDAQKLELKGDKGDNAPPPVIKVGTVETLDPSDKATVTSETNGNVTTFNFQIPQGEKGVDYENAILNSMDEIIESDDSTKVPGTLAIKEMLDEITDEEITTLFEN